MDGGWCCYDSQLGEATHIEAVRRLRPRVVRWFCSVDRHVITNSATAMAWQERYGQAWQAIAESGATLVVQLQMKRPDWTAGDSGNLVGASGWKAGPRKGWLADPNAKWVPFVRGLAAALAAHPIARVWWGAWNEPDWRIDWPWNRPKSSNAPAPTTEWEQGQWLWWPVPPAAPFGWSGGHARLMELRLMVPELTWTSDGVTAASAEWLALTAADPTVSVIDVHTYQGGRVDDDLAQVRSVVDAFDAVRVDELAIVVGEYGDDASRGTPYSTEWRDRSLRFVAALESAWPGRVAGVAAHIQGPHAPALWQIL